MTEVLEMSEPIINQCRDRQGGTKLMKHPSPMVNHVHHFQNEIHNTQRKAPRLSSAMPLLILDGPSDLKNDHLRVLDSHTILILGSLLMRAVCGGVCVCIMVAARN